MGEPYPCQGKQTWPELLGARGHEAVRKIEKENVHVKAIIVPPGFKVTMDFRCDRVWVWVNNDRIVTHVPHVG